MKRNSGANAPGSSIDATGRRDVLGGADARPVERLSVHRRSLGDERSLRAAVAIPEGVSLVHVRQDRAECFGEPVGLQRRTRRHGVKPVHAPRHALGQAGNRVEAVPLLVEIHGPELARPGVDVTEQVAMHFTPVTDVPGLPDQVGVGVQGALGLSGERCFDDKKRRPVSDAEQVAQAAGGRGRCRGRPPWPAGSLRLAGVGGLGQAVIREQFDAVLSEDLPAGLVAGHLAGRSRLEDGHDSRLQLDAFQPGRSHGTTDVRILVHGDESTTAGLVTLRRQIAPHGPVSAEGSSTKRPRQRL